MQLQVGHRAGPGVHPGGKAPAPQQVTAAGTAGAGVAAVGPEHSKGEPVAVSLRAQPGEASVGPGI